MSLIKKPSKHSVKDTMDKFEALVKTKDMTVFARVDHKQNAASVDMQMNDAEVLIFGNPKGGTVIMQKDSAAALDLPLRVAIYADDAGDVFVSYHDQHGLSGLYDVGGLPVLDVVTEALDNLTNAVIA